jgi:hypothetical protein
VLYSTQRFRSGSEALLHSAMPWSALAQYFDKPKNKWPGAQS